MRVLSLQICVLIFCVNRMAHAGFPERNTFSSLDRMRDGKGCTVSAVAYGVKIAVTLAATLDERHERHERHDTVTQDDEESTNVANRFVLGS